MCNIVNIDNNVAFICGYNINHKCNNKGHTLYGFSDGFQGNIAEVCFHYKINSGFCEKDILEILHDNDIINTMQSSTCSICDSSSLNRSLWNAI